MTQITGSVGRGGTNLRNDVRVVQNLVNQHIREIAPMPALKVDGQVGAKTIEAIVAFQRRVVHLANPDGRVDPRGRTLAALGGGLPAAQRYYYPAGPQQPLADIAVPYIGASEARGNRMGDDPRMHEIFLADSHSEGGTTDGYPWCCSFVGMCVQKLLEQSPFYHHVQPPRTASVLNFRTRWAPAQNCLVFAPTDQSYRPHKGDIVVYTFSHIGIVEEAMQNSVNTIEGNTNEAGSREGTSVLRKTRPFATIRCFIRLPIPVTYDVEQLMCRA